MVGMPGTNDFVVLQRDLRTRFVGSDVPADCSGSDDMADGARPNAAADSATLSMTFGTEIRALKR